MTCLKEERTARAVYYALEKANVKMAYTGFGMRTSVENVKPSRIGICQNVDFNSNVIRVDKQLVRLSGKLTITGPKSGNGVRDISMTQEVRQSTRNLIRKRQKIKPDMMIDRCTPHVLRHTFCTKCIASNMDVKPAQYLMGHSDARTTLNIYTDKVIGKAYESMELLEKRCN